MRRNMRCIGRRGLLAGREIDRSGRGKAREIEPPGGSGRGRGSRRVGENQVRAQKNVVFNAAAQPADFARLLINRYEPGMAYGDHVDAAYMDGVRADLSFTLF